MKVNMMKIISLLVLASVILSGCGSAAPEVTTETTAEETTAEEATTEETNEEMAKKDTVVIATLMEPGSMESVENHSIIAKELNPLTFDTLFITPMEIAPTPSLVDTYENVSDVEWIFTLHPGIKFHDGTDLTSEDVKVTLDFVMESNLGSRYTTTIDYVEIVDDLTFKIFTKGPSTRLLLDLTATQTSILPSELIESGHDFNAEPIGSGPYIFVHWKPGDEIAFVMNEDYWDKEKMPTIKNMIWKIIPEGSSRTIALQAGEVDMLYDVDQVDYNLLVEDPDVDVLSADTVNIWFVWINDAVPPFDNVLVRKAVNAALDKESIITVAANGMAVPSIAQAPMGLLGSNDENADVYDVELAKAYLEESGVDPSTIKLPIICSSDFKKRIAEVMQANLAEIGIEVEIVSMEFATYLEKTAKGEYTAAISGFNQKAMEIWLQSIFHTDSIGVINRAWYSNPDVDALIDEASITLDDAARESLLMQANAQINDDCPQLPLFQDTWIRAYDNNLGG